MRLRAPFHLATRTTLVGILLAIFANALPRPAQAQAGPALTKSWNDAVAQLADKIAAAASPTRVSLDLKNISSLDSSYAGAVELALESELRRHSFQLDSADAGSQRVMQLQLTLSESADQFIWVIQILNSSDDPKSNSTAIVSVAKTNLGDAKTDQPVLSLEKRLVWSQPERFLDFALLKDPISGDPALLVLETNRLAFYKMSDSQWQISRSNPIPQQFSPSRDPQGAIQVEKGSLRINNSECVGKPELTANLTCRSIPRTSEPNYGDVRGLPNGIGTHIPGTCRGETMFLFTGDGDWTQADSVQGYLESASSLPPARSGAAVEFNSPVISFEPEPDTSAARAVVHNLKSGNYEAYIVTATCSQ